MKKHAPIRVAMAILFMASLLSCRKEIEVSPNSLAVGKVPEQNIEAHNPNFDWDNPNTIYMPVSASSPNSVFVPWRSNGGTPLDPGIVDDYHQCDGWELVFNTFCPDDFPRPGVRGTMVSSTTVPAGGLYFALYNRYRGLMRFYLYVPPGYVNNSTQVQHGLQVYTSSNTSKMLNFAMGDISDPSVGLGNGQGFTGTSKDGISATGGWYAMQYQIAYDPLFRSTTFPNPGFRWDAYSVSVSQIKLNGTEIGSIRGSITTPKPDFDWTSAITNGVLGLAEVFGVINPAAAGATTGILKQLHDAAAGGIAGNATGFFTGVFAQRSASTQTVDLSINSTINTTGTSTGSQPYTQTSTPFPGQNVAGTNGVPPLFNHSIGVFNLSARPQIHVVVVNTPAQNFFDPSYTHYSYSSDVNEVRSLLQQNIDLFNNTATGAQLTDFKVETVIPDPAQGDPSWSVGGTAQTIGNTLYYAAYPTVEVEYQGQGPMAGPPALLGAYVRVSLHLKANSSCGPQDVFIVKTFAADVVQ